MLTIIEKTLIDYVKSKNECSSREIFDGTNIPVSYATLKRSLSKLVANNLLSTIGKGKGTKYIISPIFEVIQPVNLEVYYLKEIDERKIKEGFNFSILTEILPKTTVFTPTELKKLDSLQATFKENSSHLSISEYSKEFERLAIDLSWKSSQIEGNTYSLLETERLLKERITADGKTKEDAEMLLNHKEAIDFIVKTPDYVQPLSVAVIEDIHSILIKNLGVDRNIRKRRVGISGTNYSPLDNEFQIREAMQKMCDLINSRNNIFEKALLALVLLSYIQPFNDGNKRTARIVSNALLIANHFCPISFRTVDSVEYKKAMLVFYELNNIQPLKEIFIGQFAFAVNTYF